MPGGDYDAFSDDPWQPVIPVPRPEKVDTTSLGALTLTDLPRRSGPANGGVRDRRPPVDVEIIVPAVNEEARLPTTMTATLSYLADQPWSSAVVVVDNGSVDRTLEVARSCANPRVPVYVTGCSARGKGAAIRRGMLGSSSEVVGFMDADLATPIETLEVVLPLLWAGEAAVIGSRNLGQAARRGQPLGRRVGGWAFRQLTYRIIADLTDTQCGFKFFRRDLISPVLASATVDGFAFDVELLLGLSEAGHRVVEVPVDWVDAPGSTFSAVRHGLATFQDLVRLLQVGKAP